MLVLHTIKFPEGVNYLLLPSSTKHKLPATTLRFFSYFIKHFCNKFALFSNEKNISGNRIDLSSNRSEFPVIDANLAVIDANALVTEPRVPVNDQIFQ